MRGRGAIEVSGQSSYVFKNPKHLIWSKILTFITLTKMIKKTQHPEHKYFKIQLEKLKISVRLEGVH
jgi:hypothetical protein